MDRSFKPSPLRSVAARITNRSETSKCFVEGARRKSTTTGEPGHGEVQVSSVKRNSGKLKRGSARSLVAKARGSRKIFHAELRKLWEQSGLVQRKLAARLKISHTLFNNWITGNNPPTRNYKEVIHELEDLFGVDRGHLWNLVLLRSRKGRAEKGRYDGITDTPATRAKVTRNFTGAEMRLPHRQFKERYEEAAAKRLERADPRTLQILKSRHLGEHVELPEQVKTDLDKFVDLSTRKQWHVKSALLPLKQRAEGGAKMEAGRLKNVLDYLCNSPNGPGLPPEKLTLGLFLFPDVVRTAVGAKQDRMEQATDELYLTSEDINYFTAGKNLVSSPAGYVFQNCNEYVKQLKTIAGLVSAVDIQAARKDPLAACTKAVQRYENFRISYDQFAVPSVNRKYPVEVLLEHPDPLFALDLLNERLARNFFQTDPECDQYFPSAMDSFIARIETDCAFRAETLRKVETTELRECADGWRLKISRHKFKKPDGPYFQYADNKFRDFDRTLTDEHGIGHIIEAFLSKRSRVPGLGQNKILFVNLSGRPSDVRHVQYPGVSAKTLSERMKTMTDVYLCRPADGIPGLMPFTIHNCRDIVCSGTMKRFYETEGHARSLQLAADAIGDGIQTAKDHYARWDIQKRDKALQMARERKAA